MVDDKALYKQKETAYDDCAVDSLTSCKKDQQDDEIKEAEEGSSSWSDALPPEILSIIYSNLFLRDSSNFSATCRLWKSITPPFPPPTNSTLSKLPYLMISNNNKGIGDCKFFFQPLYNEAYQVWKEDKMISEELIKEDARIRFSDNGWLLMSQGRSSLFFFNPFTKAKIKLPDLPVLLSYFPVVTFSSLPTSLDCVVIGVSEGEYETIEFGIIKHREDRWAFREFENTRFFHINNFDSSVVFHNGNLYCLGDAGNVGVLDIGGDVWKWSWSVLRTVLSRLPFRKHIRQSYMVKCDDDVDGAGLLVVFVTHEEQFVHVKRLSLVKMVWQDLQSLGDKMLYVSHGASLLQKAVTKAAANKIYSPKFHDENGVFYSLDTGKYHSIAGNYSSNACFNV